MYRHTKETKRKISKSRKGKHYPRLSESLKGRKHTEEWKKEHSKRMSGIKNSFYGKHHTEGTKQKLRISHLGKKHSEKSIKLMIQKHTGKKFTYEHRRKLGESKKGSKNYFWQGGKTAQAITIKRTVEYRLWRESVFARDNWICQKCEKRGGKLRPHHINNFAQFPGLRFAIDNGITFCDNCHRNFHKKYGIKNNDIAQIDAFITKGRNFNN